MNNIETFNFVKAHLLKQGCKSIGDSGCMYRGLNGTSCAVGCLIKDEYYSPDLEGVGVEYIFTSVRASGCKATIKLLAKLQNIHDRTPVKSWPEELDELEKRILAGEFPDADASVWEE